MLPQRKRLYAIIIITAFSFIIVTGIGNFRAKQLTVTLTGDMVTHAVNKTLSQIDMVKMQKVISAWDQDDPYHRQLRETLVAQKKVHRLENIYMLYKDEQKAQWFMVVDAREESDPNHAPFGQPVKRVSASVEKTIRGKTVHGEYHVTSLGTFVSSYQEVKDPQGKTIAVLGGDFAAEDLTEFLSVTSYAQMGIITAVLLLIGIVAFTGDKKLYK